MYKTYIYDKISQPSYAKELNQKKSQAKKGNVIAQVEYGTACFYGIKNGSKQIVREDPVLALDYAKSATSQGNSDGYILYGLMQLYGQGKVKNVGNAFNSFLNAIKIDMNNLDAQFLLSYIFFEEGFKELDSNTAIQYLKTSGMNDSHKEKHAMFYLGMCYCKGNEYIKKNEALAIRYLSISAEALQPAQELLKEMTTNLTNGSYTLNYNSRMKNVYDAAVMIKDRNGNKITDVVEALFQWAQRKNYPPAMYECAIINLSRGRGTQFDYDQIKKSAENYYLPAIDNYITTLLNSGDVQNAMMFCKHSVYFKSNVHQNTIAEIYKRETKSINPGIYFRYRKYIDNFDSFDNNLINQLKMKAQQNGNPEELFCYAVCLENGFAGLQADPETAVQLYKKAADAGNENASRNFAHFEEFGEFVQQDLQDAIKRIEKYDDIEASSSLAMMKMMLSDDLHLPFPYSKKYKKVLKNGARDPAKSYVKLALLLIRDKLMIPNFVLAEKFANKGKKKYPLGATILAAIAGDPRAGKPNSKKADKMFQEALAKTQDQDSRELYAEFLIAEGREEEAKSLINDVQKTKMQSATRPMTAAASSARNKNNGPSILVQGEDLYQEYLNSKDIRLLERSAEGGYPIAQSLYSQYILKNRMKKQYKLALTYLQSSAEQGIYTSYVLLGYMYNKGLATKKNLEEAINMYMKAIEHYEYNGYYGLSLAYAQGKVFKKDLFMAYRYYKLAEKITALYKTPYKFNKYFFDNEGCLKGERYILDIDTNTLNMSKPKDLFNYAFYKEYKEKDYTGAFNCYSEAYRLKPDNENYKRNLAFFYFKALGNPGNYEEALEMYESLGNIDDLHNASIIKFYLKTPNTPLYIDPSIESIINRINNEKATADEMYRFGQRCIDGNGVDQNFIIAKYIFGLEESRFGDGKSSRMLAKMVEKGYGYQSNKLVSAQCYYVAALNDDGEACYNIAKILASGNGIFVDRVQAHYFIKQAKNLGYPVNDDLYEQILNQLTTRKDVFDYCEEFFTYVREIDCPRISLDSCPIEFTIDPLVNLVAYPNANGSQDEVLLQKGLQSMKGLGIAKNYDLAFSYLVQSVLKGNVKARVFLAILGRITKISHYKQVYSYNMFKAQLNGLSFAYVEEAKIELGLYENIRGGDKELAINHLQKAIDAGDIYALYIKGRYLDDRESLEEASEKGLGKASYFIGKSYLDCAKPNEAIPYLEKAVNQGHAKSNYYLGLAYLNTNNKEKAEYYMCQGANLSGNSNIMVRYGIDRLEGDRLTQNQNEAFAMFSRAHGMKNITGTLHLAKCHSQGLGVDKNNGLAAELFEIGINFQIPEFYEPASACYKQLRGFQNWRKSKKYQSEAKKVKEAVYVKNENIFYETDKVNPESIFDPWHNYELAREFKLKDLKKYVFHLQVATNLGIFSAIKETILHLLSGLYIDEDEDEAYRLLSHMIAIGWGTAYKILGDIYFTSELSIVKKNAYHYYKKAAIMKSKSGMFKYGLALSQGIGCEKDMERGCKIMDRSKCKYAYHYLTNYTSYTPKYSQDVPNCLSSLRRIVKESFTESDVQLAAQKDIKYGIIFYNIYYWKKDRSLLSPMSMIGLKSCADDGSTIANFHYGFVHYLEKHYHKSVPYLLYAADRKNYTSCHYLGLIFYSNIPNVQLARKYLSQSCLHLRNADDAVKMANLSEGKEAIDWFLLAAEYDTPKYAYSVALLIIKGDDDYKISPDRVLGSSVIRRYYQSFTYAQLFDTGLLFYKGEIVDKDLAFARKAFKAAADLSSRTDEDATKFYISMCLNGEGGQKETPELYIKQVADSDDDDYKVYAENYGMILVKKGELHYSDALPYLDKAGTKDASELASKIRSYLEAKRRAEEEKRRQEKEESGGNFLGFLGVAGFLTTVALAPVGVAVGTLAGACILGSKKDSDSD